tara:strand:+ start:15370 stop:15621 length:252 start_codon:yes stop_codon:yes gene_type:complete
MSWKKLGNGWLNKNEKSNGQNNLPMFTGDIKFSEDILAGDKVNIAMWRKVKFGKESFSLAVSINTDRPKDTEDMKKDAKSEIF